MGAKTARGAGSEESLERPARRHALAALSLCVITLLAYSNSFQAGFALDNKTLLLGDPRIREGTARNLAMIFQYTYWWPNGESGVYRPLTTLSYLFNYAVLGNVDRPAGYHWVNFGLHLANVMLVYALALVLIGQFWPSVFTATVWAVHPVSTEAVTNMVGRPDLLAALSVLGGLLIYRKSADAAGWWQRLGWLTALAAVTAAGVFSKESAVAAVGVVVLYEVARLRERRDWRGLLAGCAAMALPLAAMGYRRAVVLAAAGPAEFPFWDNPLTRADFAAARLTAIRIMARYLWIEIWPARLSCDYSYAQIGLARGSLGDWIGWMAVAAVGAGGVVLYRWNRTAFFFVAFAFVTFLPASNLIVPIGSIMAERFLYLPSVGLIGCLVLGVYAAGLRGSAPWLAPLVLGVAVVGFGARTWARNRDWRDDLAMAEAAVRTSPNSFKTHYLLAQALYASDPGHVNLDRAIGEGEKSLAILDPLPDALNDAVPYRWIGECYILRGDTTAAPARAAAYRRSIAILLRSVAIYQASPAGTADAAGAYRTLSTAYLRLEDVVSALNAAARSRKLDPGNAASYRQEAEVLVAAGRVGEAAVSLMSGVFLTADSGLWEELLRLYRDGLDAQGCATRRGAGGPALNPSCEIVRRHFCAAAPQTMQAALQTGRPDLARRIKAAGMQEFGCNASAWN